MAKPDYDLALKALEDIRIECTKMHMPDPNGNSTSVYLLHVQLWTMIEAGIRAHKEVSENMTAGGIVTLGPNRAQKRRMK